MEQCISGTGRRDTISSDSRYKSSGLKMHGVLSLGQLCENYLSVIKAAVQPGSLDSEAGIFQMKFDQSGSRLITCEADKTIKVVFKE